ncbi:CidA/LrgA family protein [Comamonas suwonensis]|uniref:CidA/LrgA family protein n=1 Tax=Comamonas suwonensis TaxID=2606214 RepID=A0A843B994_9BURK|nr:CidA/LrgA family protein [Comamonas suwonensis]MBI1626245.1 CidA/LrgA family protein [Comamonas suwonensis]
MLYAIAVLFAFQLLGEFLVRVSGLPLPGALVGTLLLLIGLLFYKRLPKPLEDTAQVLLQNMMLLFIPVIAGVMLEFGHLRREWLPFVLACVAGAAITFTATALTFRFFLQRQRTLQSSNKDNDERTPEQEQPA